MTTKQKSLLDLIDEQRSAKVEEWAKFIEAREATATETRSAIAALPVTTDEERAAHAAAVATEDEAQAAYRAAADQMEAEIRELDKRRDDQLEIERRRNEAAEAARAAGGAVVTSEERTYERHKASGENGVSYYRDLAAAGTNLTFQSTTKGQAIERLQRHAKELEVEMPKRAKAKEARALRQIEEAEERGSGGLAFDPFKRGAVDNPFERRVTPNSTPGTGGFAIPPLWLIEDYIPGLRAHAVASNLPRQMDLPAGTNSINIPKLANLTSVGYQQANNAGLVSTDWSDTYVSANVKTMGGYSDVSLQLLEQSPNHIVDEVVTTDLMSAYYTFKDQQVIAGDGVSTTDLNGGHIQGLYSSAGASAWTGYNGVAYTDASPAGWKFPSVMGAMASKISRTRFDAANYATLVHGRRWFWFATSVDANNRPLGETVNGGRFNVAAAVQSGLAAEGLVGTLPFLSDTPVYIDDNVPLTDTAGGGSAQDIAISALWDDVWLFNGDLHTDVFKEILSGTMGVRFRVYAYNAMLVRYGQSIAIASGTGFAAPTGAVSSITF